MSAKIEGLGPCAACGRDPALGFASVYTGGVERWYCHPEDGPSCYAQVQIGSGMPASVPSCNRPNCDCGDAQMRRRLTAKNAERTQR